VPSSFSSNADDLSKLVQRIKRTLYKLHNDLTYSHEAHNNYAYIYEAGDGDIYEVEGGRIRHENKAAQLAELHGNYKELGIFEKGIGS